MPAAEFPHILVLGGTTEALEVADTLSRRCRVTYSLAGRTLAPSVPSSVRTLTGGFGGEESLATWLADNHVNAVIDATHPYAGRISRNAANAASRSGILVLHFVRPAWTSCPGDRWYPVSDLEAAVSALPGLGGTAFLSVGRQELGAFAGLDDMRFLVRTVDPVTNPPLGNTVYVVGKGPFALQCEQRLLERHEVDVVVSRNSGGCATYAKIAAARALGLPVLMIDRPAAPTGEKAGSIADVVSWAERVTGF